MPRQHALQFRLRQSFKRRTKTPSFRIAPMLAAAGLTALACEPPSPAPPGVAHIAGESISVSELESFARHIPDGFHWDKNDAKATDAILDALIDKKILLLEVAGRDLYNDSEVVAQITAFRRQELIRGYSRININETITISDEEVAAHFKRTRRDRSLRPGVIVLPSLEAAHSAIEELRRGASFHELAKERSAEANTRSWGGDMGRYIRVDDADTYTRGLFQLEVNELSEPVPVMHDRRRHYAVFKVLDEVPVSLDEVESDVAQELFGEKKKARSVVHAESLWTAHGGRIDGDAVSYIAGLIQTQGREVDLSPAGPHGAWLKRELAARGDASHRLTVGAFLEMGLDAENGISVQQLGDSSWVAATVPGMLLEEIMIDEALTIGLDKDPEIVARIANNLDELAVSRLRTLQVDKYVDATPEEAQAYFDAHPEKFMYSNKIVLWEILLPTVEAADDVADQLREGTDAENLIAAHSTRAVHEKVRGQIELDRYSQAHYDGLYEHAESIAAGEVGGPIKVPEGFSVFQVIDQEPARPKPFNAASQKRAAAYVKIEKRNRGYVDFIKRLREKYEVEVYIDNVPALVVDGKLRPDLTAN